MSDIPKNDSNKLISWVSKLIWAIRNKLHFQWPVENTTSQVEDIISKEDQEWNKENFETFQNTISWVTNIRYNQFVDTLFKMISKMDSDNARKSITYIVEQYPWSCDILCNFEKVTWINLKDMSKVDLNDIFLANTDVIVTSQSHTSIINFPFQLQVEYVERKLRNAKMNASFNQTCDFLLLYWAWKAKLLIHNYYEWIVDNFLMSDWRWAHYEELSVVLKDLSKNHLIGDLIFEPYKEWDMDKEDFEFLYFEKYIMKKIFEIWNVQLFRILDHISLKYDATKYLNSHCNWMFFTFEQNWKTTVLDTNLAVKYPFIELEKLNEMYEWYDIYQNNKWERYFSNDWIIFQEKADIVRR